MKLREYNSELEKEKINEKLLLKDLHSMERREDSFKEFFEQTSFFDDEIFLNELISYEKELKIGETGN